MDTVPLEVIAHCAALSIMFALGFIGGQQR